MNDFDPQATDATRDMAATRRGESPAPGRPGSPGPGEGRFFTIGDNVYRASRCVPYERGRDDPIYRPLRLYTLDPAESRFDGAQATVQIPYEPLEPGPKGALFEVIDVDDHGRRYRAVDLEDPTILIRGGLAPSATNHLFHQQMVYAVSVTTYAAFRKALGRNLNWGFGDKDNDSRTRLKLFPHAVHDQNAWYSRTEGAIRFGYFQASEAPRGRNLPGGMVYTCLSHDIIAHEMTHALLDGLRPRFLEAAGRDGLALHEALGDLVAIFQHFSFEQVVESSIERSRGQLTEANLLADLARQFGHTTDGTGPLRSAIDMPSRRRRDARDAAPPSLKQYDDRLGVHDLGSVLVSALFHAFDTVFQRKTRDLVRLATGGTGRLPKGAMPSTLCKLLADEASSLASQFLTICIRAIDYCPPVDVTFGDYLRALITADHDLIPDDPWGYREALIDGFRLRKIYPLDVSTLAEDALLWKPPERPIRRSARLSYAKLQFRGDPCNAVDPGELQQQACEVGKLVTAPAHAELFGIVAPSDERFAAQRCELPIIESVRTSRRVGPDGQLVFDLIAEVLQRREINWEGRRYYFHGGSTVIFGPDGDVRYVISKNVLSENRWKRQRNFMHSDLGRMLWQAAGDEWQYTESPFRLVHTMDD